MRKTFVVLAIVAILAMIVGLVLFQKSAEMVGSKSLQNPQGSQGFSLKIPADYIRVKEETEFGLHLFLCEDGKFGVSFYTWTWDDRVWGEYKIESNTLTLYIQGAWVYKGLGWKEKKSVEGTAKGILDGKKLIINECKIYYSEISDLLKGVWESP